MSTIAHDEKNDFLKIIRISVWVCDNSTQLHQIPIPDGVAIPNTYLEYK